MVSDKKIFKVFYILFTIGKISPATPPSPFPPLPPPRGGHVFLTNPNSLNNLGRGSPKEHFCKIILKSAQWFLTRGFQSFLYKYKGKIRPGPGPGGHVFWQIQMAWTILVEDYQRNISAKLYWKRSNGFCQEDFLSFLYTVYYRENKARHAPLAPIPPPPHPPSALFFTNPNGLMNLGRGSPKEHFCKIILKSVQWFLTRRFLKFSI